MSEKKIVLTLSCPDRIGIVAEVARFLVDHGCNILESAQYGDTENSRFFLRTAFSCPNAEDVSTLQQAFAPVAARFAMEANFYDLAQKVRAILMVSRAGHCLNDILFRWSIGALPIEVCAIASNHRTFEPLAAQRGVPFHHLPISPETKPQQEAVLQALAESTRAELIVLARYMQVLSPEFVARRPGGIINIHHSFLPSFKGAEPYRQAYERGVKLIGATAHYVTADLDEGPIIEQDVQRVRHDFSVADYIAVGRDVEALVLARALNWHAERRILLNGARTVVFR